LSGLSLITKGILAGIGGDVEIINRYVTPIKASVVAIVQQINVTMAEAKNINIRLTENKNINVVLNESQSVNVKLNDAKTINVKYRRV